MTEIKVQRDLEEEFSKLTKPVFHFEAFAEERQAVIQWIKEIAACAGIDVLDLEVNSIDSEHYELKYNGPPINEDATTYMAYAQIAWIRHFYSITDKELK